MNNIIRLTIPNQQELARRYIQHFQGGGLLLSAPSSYQLGAEVFLLVDLPAAAETLAVAGKVAWISPSTSVAYPPGFGVQFNPDKAGIAAKLRIELILGDLLQSRTASYTF